MSGSPVVAKIELVAGLVLVVGPVLTVTSGDWLLPAELFPAVLAGGVLITLASPRGSANRRLGGIALMLSAGALILGTLVTALMGLLAPAVAESTGWQAGSGIFVLAVYALGVVLMLATGWFEAREVFGKKPTTAPASDAPAAIAPASDAEASASEAGDESEIEPRA